MDPGDEGLADGASDVIRRFSRLIFKQAAADQASEIRLDLTPAGPPVAGEGGAATDPMPASMRVWFRIGDAFHELPSPPKRWAREVMAVVKRLVPPRIKVFPLLLFRPVRLYNVIARGQGFVQKCRYDFDRRFRVV